MAKRKMTTTTMPPEENIQDQVSSDTFKKSLTQEVMRKFLGPIKNHLKTDIHHLWGNKYRVNVWSKQPSDQFIDNVVISQSYFVNFDGLEVFIHTGEK